MYGGKSAEHNVSLQTALAVTKALNTEKFDIHPIYITEKGEWQRGPLLTELGFQRENASAGTKR